MQNKAWENLELTLTFKGNEAQNLIDLLAQLPFHMSANVINAIQQQTVPQIMQFEMKLAKEKTPEGEEA
jgi:hypothetical protein